MLGSKISDTMITNIESSQLLSSILSLLSSFQIYKRSISNIIKCSREKTLSLWPGLHTYLPAQLRRQSESGKVDVDSSGILQALYRLYQYR